MSVPSIQTRFTSLPKSEILRVVLLFALFFYQIRGLTIPIMGYGFRPGDFLMAVAVAGIGLNMIRRRLWPRPTALVVSSLLLVGSALLSLVNAKVLGAAVAELLRLVFVAGVTVVLVSWFTYHHETRFLGRFVELIVGTAAFLSLLGLVGAALYYMGYRTPLVHDSLELRINPLFHDPNHFANYLNVALYLNLLLVAEKRTWYWIVTLGLNLVGLLLTLSCGGLGGATVAAFIVLLGSFYSVRRLIIPAVIILIVTGLSVGGICGTSLVSKFLDRGMSSKSVSPIETVNEPAEISPVEKVSQVRKYSAATSLSDKLDTWKAALRGFQQYPWIGMGADNFKFRYDELRSSTARLSGVRAPHNTYLKILAEQGILGFGAFCLLVVLAVWWLLQTGGTETAFAYRWTMMGALVANLVQAMVLDVLSSRTLWLTLALIALGPPLLSRRLSVNKQS